MTVSWELYYGAGAAVLGSLLILCSFLQVERTRSKSRRDGACGAILVAVGTTLGAGSTIAAYGERYPAQAVLLVVVLLVVLWYALSLFRGLKLAESKVADTDSHHPEEEQALDQPRQRVNEGIQSEEDDHELASDDRRSSVNNGLVVGSPAARSAPLPPDTLGK